MASFPLLNQTVRLQSVNYPDRRFTNNGGAQASIETGGDNNITIHPSPIAGTVRFHSAGGVLRHSGFAFSFAADNLGDALLVADSSFVPVQGLSGAPGSFSFRSSNFPDRYIRHSGFKLFLHPFEAGNALYAADASFTGIPTNPFVGHTVRFVSNNFPGKAITNLGAAQTGIEDGGDQQILILPSPSTPGYVRFHPASNPGLVMRHSGFAFSFAPDNRADALLVADSSFRALPGIADASSTSFESLNFPGRFIRHSGFKLFLHPFEAGNALYAADATFRGTSSFPQIGGAARLRSHNFPDRFLTNHGVGGGQQIGIETGGDQVLYVIPSPHVWGDVNIVFASAPGALSRHSGFVFQVSPDDGTELTHKDAAFKPVAGLAGGGGISFQSANFPDRYLRHSGFKLFLHPFEAGNALYAADATFHFA